MATRDERLDNMYSYRCEYVKRELDSAGKSLEKFSAEDEENITSMHYFGNSAIDTMAKRVKIGPNSNVLDAGSGFGSSARYFLEKVSKYSYVTACEYLPEYHEFAKELTKFKDYKNQLKFVQGDLVSADFGQNKFDLVYSFLVILHIDVELRSKLFKNMAKFMKKGSYLYIEDYFSASNLNDEAKSKLLDYGKNTIAFSNLPTKEEYILHLSNAGFEILEFVDETEEWLEYTKSRHQLFKMIYGKKVELHGEGVS